MTTQNPFLSDVYKSDRNLIKHSITQYTLMISRMQGLDPEVVRAQLIDYFKNNPEEFKSRRAKVIIKNKNEDREVKVIPFSRVLKYVQEKNYHFSPSMIAYTHSDEEECVNSIGTRDFIDNRKKYKDLRQVAKAENNKDNYSKYNELQNAFKIFNNAQSGAMSSEGTPINNKTGHTSLTSTTRCLTSTANLVNEQFIAGNRFYNTPNNTIQSIVARLQVSDFDRIDAVMKKWNLHYPTVAEMMDVVVHCSRRYWESDSMMGQIKAFLETLKPVELASLMYTLDLVSLFRYNQEVISAFFDKYVQIPDYVEGSEGLKPNNGDRYVLCISKLPRDASKVDINNLNAHHMMLETEYRDLISTFFKSDIPPTGLYDVVNAVRDCVLTSDTDSSIYTVDEMIDAYTTDHDKGIMLNAVLTYFIRMISVDQHAQLSSNMNVSKRNLNMLGMKNEYYFGAYFTTSMSKHYYASQRMVEGVMNKEPEMEIKGVHLKSSKIAGQIKDKAQEIMKMGINAVETNTQLDAAQILYDIAEMERGVLNDINSGVWSWFTRETIKNHTAYTNPFSEKYLYHDMWINCFSEKYGQPPELPYVGIKMSVDLTSKTKLNEWVESLEDPIIRAKVQQWLLERGKDKLTSLYVPMERLQNLGDIPAEFKQAIDFRTIIKQNFKSVYEIMHSTGIYMMNDSITRLVSDEH